MSADAGGASGDPAAGGAAAADAERRFGGLRRLYGAAAYERIRGACLAVVGLGGVGSWAAEALARSGVARLVLIDLDHVAESNINRQIQALGNTVGRAKVLAMAERIADIHPGCAVHGVEDFVDASNWPGLLGDARPDAVIDACDDGRAKTVLAAWALVSGVPFVCVGAAGGRARPQDVRVTDLGSVTHDPLLATLRQRLRRHHGAPGQGPIGVRCVHSRADGAVAAAEAPARTASGLQCAGYGSSVMVTATFGLTAAAEALDALRPAARDAVSAAVPRLQSGAGVVSSVGRAADF